MGDTGDSGPLDVAERGDHSVLSDDADLGDAGEKTAGDDDDSCTAPSAAAILASLRKIRSRRYRDPNTGLRSRPAGPPSWAAMTAAGSGDEPISDVQRRHMRQRLAENMRRMSFCGRK